MEPVSALIIAMAAAWAITRGAAGAAVSQARQEARAAADAIRDDLRSRSEAWAKTLADRVADGRAGGPATGMWWAWAAARTGRAVRGALRREPLEGEPANQIRGTTGPWRRIWDAAVTGARVAWDEAREQQGREQEPSQVRLGVCEKCGAVVTRASLEETTVGPAQRRLRVCVACRAPETDQTVRPFDQAREGEDAVDADIVPDPPAPRREQPGPGTGGPELDAPPTGGSPAKPAGPKPNPQPPAPTPQPSPAAAATIASPTPQIDQGEPMTPRAPGQLVPRHGNRVATLAARATGAGGESYTHGQWDRAVADIDKRLAELPASLEMMLHRLTSADAGRSQVTGVIALHDQIVLFMKQVREMLTQVDRLERPVLTAVEAAGGPDEIAGIPYLREV